MASFLLVVSLLAFSGAIALKKPKLKDTVSSENDECPESKTTELAKAPANKKVDAKMLKLQEKEHEFYENRVLSDQWARAALTRIRNGDLEIDPVAYMKKKGTDWNKTLYFIRASQHHCSGDGPLTEDGYAQCDGVKRHWPETIPTIDAVIACPMVRCMETALEIFPAEKVFISPYIQDYQATVLKQAGDYLLEQKLNSTKALMEEYDQLWDTELDKYADSWTAGHFRLDPDNYLGTEFVTPEDRFAHVLASKRYENFTNIAIISHKRYMNNVLGGHSSNYLKKGNVVVRGLQWEKNTATVSQARVKSQSFHLIPFHTDDWWNLKEPKLRKAQDVSRGARKGTPA